MNALKKLTKRKEFNILAIIVVLAIVILIANPTFITPSNLIYMVKNNLVMWILSLGMLLVIISGGIDVSIPANITLGTIVVGYVLKATDGAMPAWINLIVVILAACLACVIFGMINGLIIAKLKIPPIITTLAMQSIANGAILWRTNGNWITGLPQWFLSFGKISLFGIRIPEASGSTVGIPVQFLFLLFAILLTSFILRYTLMGRGVYAIGGNRISAERVGYRPDRITVFIYAYIGFLAGIAAVAHTSIVEQVDPNAFVGIDMMIIAAAVIGGASVLGGTGTVFGTVLGSILVAELNNGMVLVRIPALWHKAVLGIVIIGALSIDVWQRKREMAKLVKVDVE